VKDCTVVLPFHVSDLQVLLSFDSSIAQGVSEEFSDDAI